MRVVSLQGRVLAVLWGLSTAVLAQLHHVPIEDLPPQEREILERMQADRERPLAAGVKGSPAQEAEIARRKAAMLPKLGDEEAVFLIALWARETRLITRQVGGVGGRAQGMGAPGAKAPRQAAPAPSQTQKSTVVMFGAIPFRTRETAAEVVARFYVMSPYDYVAQGTLESRLAPGTKREVHVQFLGRYPLTREGEKTAEILAAVLNPAVFRNLGSDSIAAQEGGRLVGITATTHDGGDHELHYARRTRRKPKQFPANVPQVQLKVYWSQPGDFGPNAGKLRFDPVSGASNALVL